MLEAEEAIQDAPNAIVGLLATEEKLETVRYRWKSCPGRTCIRMTSKGRFWQDYETQ